MTMAEGTSTAPTDEWRAVTSLGEPTRRAIYDYIVSVGGWVGRDQAADAVGLERGTVVHHLDRLAADGLLEVSFQRLTGRQGPGAGRPAKLYRRSRKQFDVSLPPREYELAGQMLAAAVDRSRADGTDIDASIVAVAGEHGRRLGTEARDRVHHSARGRARRRALLATLTEHGYEPQVHKDGSVVLRNCPFHGLAQRHTDLVCGMNLCLLGAAVEALEETELEATLEPAVGSCCVRLRPST
jgi:predicted ArsR family transcriptional regulator